MMRSAATSVLGTSAEKLPVKLPAPAATATMSLADPVELEEEVPANADAARREASARLRMDFIGCFLSGFSGEMSDWNWRFVAFYLDILSII